MITGQIDIDEAISFAEADCPECPDPASCQAEGICHAALSAEPADDSAWDLP